MQKKSKIIDVEVIGRHIFFYTDDGYHVTHNIEDYPRLQSATEDQLNNWTIIAEGRGVHWEDLDEDLSLGQ